MRNDVGSDAGNSVALRLEGVRCNRDAIGSRVELSVEGRRLVKSLHAGYEDTEERPPRAPWLVIEDLDRGQRSSSPLPDMNIADDTGGISRFVPPGQRIFRRTMDSGRVDVRRDSNTIRVTARGVDSFRLLLSTEAFDFNEPIVVIVNDTEVFEETVDRNLETLLRWAARDNDRTMLYGAEIEIRLD